MYHGVDVIFLMAYGAFVLYGMVGYFMYEFEKMYWNDWNIP